jgi:ABC-2 type transport system permease protein
VPRLAAEGKITAETFAGIDKWLRWLPPGLAAHAIQDASAGHAGTALLRLGLLAAVIVVLAGLWVRSLGRALVRVDTSTQSSAVRGRPLPFARSGIRGTVAGRYLIYQRRDPGSFVRWCIVAVVMGAAAVSTVRTPHYHVALILSAVLGAWILGVYNANSIGLTGPAFGLEASALSGARALRAYLAGRGIALAIIAVPLMMAASFAIAAVAGHPADGLWVAAIDLAGIGAGLALSSIFSVALAYPAEKRAGNPMPRAADGYGGRVFAGTFGTLLGVVLATVPVILAVEFTNSVPAAVRIPVLVVGAAGYGLTLAWAGARIAARAAERQLPELYGLAVRSKL